MEFIDYLIVVCLGLALLERQRENEAKRMDAFIKNLRKENDRNDKNKSK